MLRQNHGQGTRVVYDCSFMKFSSRSSRRSVRDSLGIKHHFILFFMSHLSHITYYINHIINHILNHILHITYYINHNIVINQHECYVCYTHHTAALEMVILVSGMAWTLDHLDTGHAASCAMPVNDCHHMGQRHQT